MLQPFAFAPIEAFSPTFQHMIRSVGETSRPWLDEILDEESPVLGLIDSDTHGEGGLRMTVVAALYADIQTRPEEHQKSLAMRLRNTLAQIYFQPGLDNNQFKRVLNNTGCAALYQSLEVSDPGARRACYSSLYQAVAPDDLIDPADFTIEVGNFTRRLARVSRKLNAGAQPNQADTDVIDGGGLVSACMTQTLLEDPPVARAIFRSTFESWCPEEGRDELLFAVAAKWPQEVVRLALIEGYPPEQVVTGARALFSELAELTSVPYLAVDSFVRKATVNALVPFREALDCLQPAVRPEEFFAERIEIPFHGQTVFYTYSSEYAPLASHGMLATMSTERYQAQTGLSEDVFIAHTLRSATHDSTLLVDLLLQRGGRLNQLNAWVKEGGASKLSATTYDSFMTVLDTDGADDDLIDILNLETLKRWAQSDYDRGPAFLRPDDFQQRMLKMMKEHKMLEPGAIEVVGLRSEHLADLLSDPDGLSNAARRKVVEMDFEL